MSAGTPRGDEARQRPIGNGDQDKTLIATLQALAEASVRIAAARTLKEALHVSAAQARLVVGAHLGATHGVTGLDWRKAAVEVSLSDKYAAYRDFAVPPTGAGIYAEVVRKGVPLRLQPSELDRHPAWGGYGRHSDRHPPIAGLLAVPILGRDGAHLGVLMVSDKEVGAFSAQDEAILAQLAQVTAVALERTEAEDALRESEQRFRATYENAGIGIGEADANGRLLRVNEAFCALTGYAREQLLGMSFFDLTHVDDRERERENYRAQVEGRLDRYVFEKRSVRRDGSVFWLDLSASAVRDGAGRFLYGIRVVRDVTERRVAEERQALLLHELSHRVKNTLATVQSIANQSLRKADTPDLSRGAFLARLAALSRTHDLLMHSRWVGVSLRDVLQGELSPSLLGERHAGLRLQGPDMLLSAKAALTIGMTFHELATNALRHGALSVPAGQLAVSWDIEPARDADARLRIEWAERAGPKPRPIERRGFGSKLVARAVPHDLGGNVNLDYAGDGLVCTIRVPLQAILPVAASEPSVTAS